MPFYVYYDDPIDKETFGRIGSTLFSMIDAPTTNKNRLVFKEPFPVDGKAVDIEKGELIDDPTPKQDGEKEEWEK